MKKIILSSTVIILFGVYSFFLRSGDLSAQLFKPKPQPVELANNPDTSVTKTTGQVTRQTNCVYIPADKEDQENYNDEAGEDGNNAGHYKCTTTIVPVPVVAVTPTPITKPVTTPTPNPVTKPVTTPTPTPVVVTPPPVTKPKNSKWKDGTYIGDSVDAYYGNVQVSVTLSNDRITGISFLDYPQDRRTSLQKSNYSMPILKSEAISAQSANVDSVSGATYTSEAFSQSLTSALSQARI